MSKSKKSLAKLVADAPPSNRKLQILHTCDGFTARTIIDDEKLKTSPRDSYDGEKLLFFYYGRPAYRLSTSSEPTSHSFFLPVCLVLTPDALHKPKRIYPFDTGAFEAGLFSGSVHPNMERDDFLLHNGSDTAQKLVSIAFETNENYFKGNPKSSIEYDKLDFEVESYVSILKGEAGLKLDDRRSAIEYQIDKDLILDSSNLEAVILPSTFIDSVRIREFFVEKCEAKLFPYEVYHFNVNEYTSEIYKIAQEYLGLVA